MDVQLLLILMAGHYLADYGLQNQHMAEAKQYALVRGYGFHALTAHAFIHALIAGMITGSFPVGIVVGVTHWLIDFGKASILLTNPKTGKKGGLYGLNVDQALHILVLVIVVLVVV